MIVGVWITDSKTDRHGVEEAIGGAEIFADVEGEFVDSSGDGFTAEHRGIRASVGVGACFGNEKSDAFIDAMQLDFQTRRRFSVGDIENVRGEFSGHFSDR